MSALSRPEAVLFDMGGVLLEAADRWDAEHFPLSFPDGLPEPVPLDWFLEMSEAVIGSFLVLAPPRPAVDSRPIVAQQLKRGGIEPTDEAVEHWMRVLAQWEVRPLFDFVRPTIEALAGLDIRMGLVSNTLMDGALHRANFQRNGIFDHLECMVFSAEFGVNKPHPAIFRHALETMDLAPNRAWYVGDKPQRDCQGAHGVGMTAVLVNSAHTDHMADAPENRPDLWIRDMSALPGIVRRLSGTG